MHACEKIQQLPPECTKISVCVYAAIPASISAIRAHSNQIPSSVEREPACMQAPSVAMQAHGVPTRKAKRGACPSHREHSGMSDALQRHHRQHGAHGRFSAGKRPTTGALQRDSSNTHVLLTNAAQDCALTRTTRASEVQSAKRWPAKF